MKRLLALVLCGLAAGALLGKVHSAHAVEAFKKEFFAKYVKKDSSEPAQQGFAAAAEKANCNVCHVGKSKKNRNDYGKALAAHLTKKDAKDLSKIQQELDKVAEQKSNPADPNSPTFGDLIKEGKLPGGNPPAEAAAAGN